MDNIDINQLPKELLEERVFEFNKKGVPEELRPLLIEIEHNKRKWKSLYMAVWGLPLYVLNPIIDRGHGDYVIPWVLPATKHKLVLYTPIELKGYLTNYDKDTHINQVIKIFTLLEDYFFMYNGLTEKPRKSVLVNLLKSVLLSRSLKRKLGLEDDSIDFTRFYKLKRYLQNKNLASSKELAELELAKETRNCFVHRRGLISKRWLKVYKKTNRKDKYNIHNKAPTAFSDIEDWTDLIVKIIGNSIKRFNNS